MASDRGVGSPRSGRLCPSRRSLIWVAAAIIVVCNLIDIGSTAYILSIGGQELNPLAAFLLQYSLLWPFKVSLVGWIALGAWLSRHEPMRARVRLMWAVACIYLIVVAWNVIPLLLHLT